MKQVRAAPWLWEPLLLLVQGMFFPRVREDQELENHAVEPVIKETERMVYVAFSEYFFDSAMHSYFQAGVLTIELQGEKVRSTRYSNCVQEGRREGWAVLQSKGGAIQGAALLGPAAVACSPSSGLCSPQVPKDLEVLLRATFFGTIFMLVRSPQTGWKAWQSPRTEHSPSLCLASNSPAFPRALLWMLRCGWCCRSLLPLAAPSNPRGPQSLSLLS